MATRAGAAWNGVLAVKDSTCPGDESCRHGSLYAARLLSVKFCTIKTAAIRMSTVVLRHASRIAARNEMVGNCC